MTEEAMRSAFIGKTLDGHYGNGLTWTETYFGDGRLEYRESARQATGRWHFRGHVFCTFYDPPLPQPPLNGGCWTAIKTSANCYEFYLAGLSPDPPVRRRHARHGASAGTRAAGARRSPPPAARSRACEVAATGTPLRRHLAPQILHGRLHAAAAVRDGERLEAHLHGAQRAQHHGRVGVAHVGDAEGLAAELAQADAQHHAALVAV